MKKLYVGYDYPGATRNGRLFTKGKSTFVTTKIINRIMLPPSVHSHGVCKR
jgi:hypothetical protein